MNPLRPVTDEELRAMRNVIYPAQQADQVQTDAAWELVKGYWRRDVVWLTDAYNKSNKTPATPEKV